MLLEALLDIGKSIGHRTLPCFKLTSCVAEPSCRYRNRNLTGVRGRNSENRSGMSHSARDGGCPPPARDLVSAHKVEADTLTTVEGAVHAAESGPGASAGKFALRRQIVRDDTSVEP